MHIVTVNHFLCCFRLETGGYFLGWLGAIFTALALVLVVAFGVLADLTYESLNETLKTMGMTTSDYYLTKFILESRILLIVCLVIITIYLMYCFYANVSLIIGTKNRNHERIEPILIVTVIGILLGFLPLMSFTWQNITSVAISTVVDVYVYICLYSLYIKLKNDTKYKFPESP